MPKFKIIHISDGTPVANFIAKKLTANVDLQITVDIHHLKPVTPSTQVASSETSDDIATISILLVTPSMMVYLKGLKDEERLFLADMMKSEQEPVGVSCFVPVPEVLDQIAATFLEANLDWQHIDIGPSRRSFHQCVIELMSMLEETMGDLPIPTLKKFHLLPEKMVFAGDTIYILLEKHLITEDPVQSLSLVFDDDRQVKANLITDGLYQFDVPESLESSKKIEVFISEGQSIGEDVIQYRDKLQVFADILCDLLSPIEALCQSVETAELSKEKMDPVISDWFKLGKASPGGDTRTLLTQWVKSIQSEKVSPESVHQELPLFLYLCAKHNLHTFSQTLLEHLKTSKKAATPAKAGPSQGSSESEKDVQTQLSAEKEGNGNLSYEAVSDLFTPGYCTPDDIFVEPRTGKKFIYVDVTYKNINPRKIASAILPGEVRNRSVKEKLCKSCPPICARHGQAREKCSEPCYSNVLNCKQQNAGSSKCSLANCSNQQCINESECQASGSSTAIPEADMQCCSYMNVPAPSQEETTSSSGSNRIPPRVPTEIPSSNKNGNPSRPPYHERPATPIMPKQNLKLSLLKDINIQNNSDEEIKPCLPPRPNSDSSKSNDTLKAKKSRRRSLASPVSPSAPPLNHFNPNSLSLPRPPQTRSNIHGQYQSESYAPPIPPRSSETALRGSHKNKAPPIPYSCRPSPPIPKSVTHKDELLRPLRSSNAVSSKRFGSILELSASGNHLVRSSVSGDSQNSQNEQDLGEDNPDIPPDYSHPLNQYSQNFNPDFNKSNDESMPDEDIYDNIADELSEFFQNSGKAEEDFIYDVPRKFDFLKELQVQPTSPQSPEPPSPQPPVSTESPYPPTSRGKKSSKSSPIWSSFSSKLLRKSGKSRKTSVKM